MHPLIDPKKIVVGSVVGINYSGMHDTSVAIVSPSGKPIFAVSLERLTRTKQDGRWPTPLLKDIPWERIAKVAISVSKTYTPPETDYTSKIHPLPLLKLNDADRSHGSPFLRAFDDIPAELVFIPHHLSHAASTFWSSGYEKATCLIYDGGMSNEAWFGGIYQASLSKGVNPFEQFSAVHCANITVLYTAVTALLGFTPLKHEGKITGLAAYGRPNKKCREILDQWLIQPELLHGLLFWTATYDQHELPRLNVNPIYRDTLKSKLDRFSREDIAATVQSMAERHVLDLLKQAQALGVLGKNICLSGGLFANVKINQRVGEFGFDNVYISPPMSDDGTAIGAAWHVVSNFSSFQAPGPVHDMYLGPAASSSDAHELIHDFGIKVSATSAMDIASKLASGLTVSIYRGASEYGPRALGNRSILAPATENDVNQKLNSRLDRTEFMPFAPVIRDEDANQYFKISERDRLACQFMTITVNCTKKCLRECPAIVHVDGTARPQLVSQESNPFLHDILGEYKKITGKSALVNTSFNIHEEPIVCSADDALRGFFEAGLDFLYMEDIGLIDLKENREVQIKYLSSKIKSLRSSLADSRNRMSRTVAEFDAARTNLHAAENKIGFLGDEITDLRARLELMGADRERAARELEQVRGALEKTKIAALSMAEKLVDLLHSRNKEWAERIMQEPATLVPGSPNASQNKSLRGSNTTLQVATKHVGTAGYDQMLWPTGNVCFPKKTGQRILYYFVDHTILCETNTGLQRVVRRLGESLLDAGEIVRFVKWDDFHRVFVLLNHDELSYLSEWHGPNLHPNDLKQYPLANEPLVAVQERDPLEAHWLIVPEVPHITFQNRPITSDVLTTARRLGLKTAFVFYDAIPLRRNELKSMAPDHETYMQQLLLSDLIVPISRWSAFNLASFFHVHECASALSSPHIEAIPLPGESLLAQRVTAPPQEGTSQLILSVGTITPHKNQLALVRAFEKFCDIHPETDWKLVLAGNVHPDVAGEINRAVRQNPRIQYLHHVADEELAKLYQGCSFTVFPSIEEGFGLPILESLWYGKPCICANFGAMAEVADGGGCLPVDTRNPDEILRAMTLLIENRSVHDKLSVEALSRPITTWKDYARQFSGQLNKVGDPLEEIEVIYYWIDHTCTYPTNSGIQRVVRGLARALLELGLKLIPVKWDAGAHQFRSPSDQELNHLKKWNGPDPAKWSAWIDPNESSPNDWLLIPELTTYMGNSSLTEVRRFASSRNLRIACVFYDAIPWKMTDIYPSGYSEVHRRYMEDLNNFELILPISQFSRTDLLLFLAGNGSLRTPGLDHRIQASVLPGEFLESSRVMKPKRGKSSVIKILSVATVEPRKNYLSLLEAFARLLKQTKKRMELVIVGNDPFPELAAQVQQYVNSHPEIRWEKGADDTRLRELYADCDFTVYPSVEEGFGLPILESLWNARPCICRNSGAMAEVATGGGCLTVDTKDPDELAKGMLALVENDKKRSHLAKEAINRPFKTWRDYAHEVAIRMATERHIPAHQTIRSLEKSEFYGEFHNLPRRPLLSICITTYNRAEWLSVNLRNLARILPLPDNDIEIVVCDNTSTDHTPEVVQPYLQRSDFKYYRNPENVGMLGNLKVTAHHAQGQYIWVLGDDDLVKPQSITKILQVIKEHPDLGLIYLNYAYTRESNANSVTNLDQFITQSTPIAAPGADIPGNVRRICAESENFFTAIYCLVFRRDHALRAYSQNTEGRPFSTMLTCIPTTYYVLNFMMDESAYWIGEPQLVVNLNVSWIKFAPLWILERIPEVYDLAEQMGADPEAMDRWRTHSLPNIVHYFEKIYESDEEGNLEYFSPLRLISRIKHLEGFSKYSETLRRIYEKAHESGHPAAMTLPSTVFASVHA